MTLVINFGSSSVKLSLFVKGESILNASCMAHRFPHMIKRLAEEFTVDLVAHRFVHGGPHVEPYIIAEETDLSKLKELLPLDPLHNPLCYEGIEKARQFFPVRHVAVFDTAFFHDLPLKAATYALPPPLCKKYGIRRFGFHGLSHEAMARSVKSKKLITVHLGSGCSMAAIRSGKPLDTSMGFTPLEGLVMATRAGDLDPGLVLFLKDKVDLENLLHYKAGLLGLTGSRNMKQLLQKGSFALDLFCYRIEKYIGAYTAALQGLDTLIFSGGIGENNPQIRQKIIPTWLGARLDLKANRAAFSLVAGETRLISHRESAVAIYVMGCDENRRIYEAAHA